MLTDMIRWRRALHRIPETDWQVEQTRDYLAAQLAPMGCRIFSPVGSALCARFDCGAARTVAFRSDMDALPITEKTGLPFASEHAGRMHACGHDGHMAILLGLAQSLSRTPPKDVNVLLIFEPAEETTGGAKAICESGALDAVDEVYGLHLWPELPKGVVASRAGGMMSRSCEMTVTFAGKSVHLAKWREGCDATAAAARFVCALYDAVQDVDCLARFGTLRSGQARGQVSDLARLEGSLRCTDEALHERLREQVRVLAQREAHGCTAEVSFSEGYPPVTNDAALLHRAAQRFPVAQAEKTFITEDFSFYQKKAAGVFFFLGTGREALHSPYFDFDETVLEQGLALFRALL